MDATRACESCGATAAADAAFCSQCGARLRSQSAGRGERRVGSLPGTGAASAALRRSERKVVTVLFADIKGSLALVAGHDPELAGEILGAVVACMGGAVRRYGGLVNQIMGDGIMALFGAPVAMENHAAQASLAALAMRLTIQEQIRPAVQVRVGLGSGEVVVRAVPGDVGLHYSAAGEAVHLASRMEQSAKPDQILLTETTRQLAGAVIVVRGMADVEIKGIDGAMPVFELVGTATSGGSAVERHHEAGRRLIGRDREMDVLRHARDRAAAGEGQAIRLVGDAGTGKSHLVREFAELHLLEPWQFCKAEAVPHRRTGYGVVSDLLAKLFSLGHDDPADVRREKVRARLDVPMGRADQALTPLSALLGLQAEEPGWSGLDGWERRERTIAATAGVFQHLSRRYPLAVVVEDAHWLDAESATSIQRLGATAEGGRLLGVVTERGSQDGETTSWSDARWIECPVRPLDVSATMAFLRSRLLAGPDVASLEQKLIEHTSGNPLFLEECLAALAESGELVRVGDRYQLQSPVQSLRVPASLRGLLDARVDRLGDAEKDVLQAAAVVGSTVPLDLLRNAVSLDDSSLDRALGRLVEAGFLIDQVSSRTRYAFRHGLIREAAYSGILKRSRVRMHGAVLDALVRRPGSSEPVVDLLANHAVQAEIWPKALTYAQKAAVRAFQRYANPEAVHYYDQALVAARHLSEGAERDATLMQLLIAKRWPLFHVGNLTGLAANLDEAVALAGKRPGYGELAHGTVLRSHVQWLRGAPAQALADAAQAAELARLHEDRDLLIRARFQRGLVGLSQSNIAGTLADMSAVVEHLAPAWKPLRYGLDVRLVVNALGCSARMHAAAGSVAEARARCDRTLALAASLEERQVKIYAQLAESAVSLAEGRIDHALVAAAQADELCRGADVRLLSPVAAGMLAQAHLAAGQADQALPIVRQAVEDAERMGFMALHPLRLAILAETLLAGGRTSEALEMARRAQELAVQVGEGGAEAMALGVMAVALQREGEGKVASLRIGAAIQIASRLGLAPLVAALRARGVEPAVPGDGS